MKRNFRFIIRKDRSNTLLDNMRQVIYMSWNRYRIRLNIPQLSGSITCLNAKTEFPYLTEEHFPKSAFQLRKYSSCCTLLHSSLYTQSPSSDSRQCGDSPYSRLFWIKFGAIAVNIIFWTLVHCGSPPTNCTRFLVCLAPLCPFNIYIYIYIYIYTTLVWGNLHIMETY
jgi:hypothetical protein